jgi:hypothetical protein
MGDESMSLLLDTHVWLWPVEAPDKLGRRTKALLVRLRFRRQPIHSVTTVPTVRAFLLVFRQENQGHRTPNLRTPNAKRQTPNAKRVPLQGN